MDKGEMKAGAARVAINLEDVLPFDGFDALRHEIFARAFVVEGRLPRSLRPYSSICVRLSRMSPIATAPFLGWSRPTRFLRLTCAPLGIWPTPMPAIEMSAIVPRSSPRHARPLSRRLPRRRATVL